MLRSTDELEKGFKALSEKTKKECGKEIERMNTLALFSGILFKSYINSVEKQKDLSEVNLYEVCLCELLRTTGYIMFLSTNGLYRNAYDCIRHTLESVVQAVYIDSRHPKTSLDTKIEILKEIEEKTEYHASRLIDKLKIDHKDELQAEYKELSRMIHPSHRQVLGVLRDLKAKEPRIPTLVDCEEISRICESMRKTYDIFTFIILYYHPELREAVKKDKPFIKGVKILKMHLVSNIIGIGI